MDKKDLELKIKIGKLNYFIELFDRERDDLIKATEVFKVYNTPRKFILAYKSIIDFGKENPLLKDKIPSIIDIYEELLKFEKNGIYKDNFAILKNKPKTYEYYSEVMKHYLKDNISYNSFIFYDKLNINKSIFNSAVRNIKVKDTELYNLYLSKVEENKEKKYKKAIFDFSEIAKGIKTGFLSNDEVFDLCMFWKLVPFKYSDGLKNDFLDFKKFNNKILFSSGSFYKQVSSFVRATLPDDCDVVLNYMKENKLFNYIYISLSNFRFDSNCCIFYGKNEVFYNEVFSLNEDEVVLILNYLKDNDLPPLLSIFKIMYIKYINGEIDFSVKKIELKK